METLRKRQQSDYLLLNCLLYEWDEYVVPEGKFDIIMFGKVSWDAENKKPVKHFVKEYDGEYPAKDSLGALDSLPDELPNDLSIVVEELRKIYG